MKFMIGCNYWASHAGIDMWNRWDKAQVEQDFALLRENGINTMRMFINWRDFQPVTALYAGGGTVETYVMSDLSEPKNPWFLDETMLEHFDEFCDLAEQYGFSLIVGIVTGWMSGRLYTPPAVDGRNVHSDPVALRFEIKLVSGIVSRFRHKKAIVAWDLGNESNCMNNNTSRDEAYNWSMLIANTIRANDPIRPVVSGMHGLVVENGSWRIEDQSEATDILTTHPYAYFVPHCSVDPMNSIRTLMHGTCETLLYSHIGQKPCLVEELGTLSKSICSDEVSAQFMNLNLFSNWAYGSPGVLWWCAHEQNELTQPPYNWCMLERELGMLDKNRHPKAYFRKMTEFARWLETTGLEQDPPETDSAILLTKHSDHWGLGYMTFVLAKQAGLEPEFVAPNHPIPKKKAYLLPSTEGSGCLYKAYYDQLKYYVAEGATLYLSNASAFFSEGEEFFGFGIHSTETKSDRSGTFALEGRDLPYQYEQRRLLEPIDAKVIASDDKGNPLLLEHTYGKGKVVFLNFPMEKQMLSESYAFDLGRHSLYQFAFRELLAGKDVRAQHDKAIVVRGKHLVTVINFSGEAIDPQIQLQGVAIDRIYHGTLDHLEPCDACVFSVK